MKKYFSFKMMLIGLFATISMGSFAATGDGANTIFTFTWDDSDNTATITGFVNNGAVAAVEIPATVSFPKTDGADPTTFKVTAIKADAFLKETGIISVSFASGSNLTTINATAFKNCTALATIDFTNATKLTTIGVNAFEGTAITVLDLEATKVEQVNNLFNSKFSSPAVVCPLTTVKLPNTWTSIENSAFINCPNLTTLSLGLTKPTSGTQTIGTNAFEGAKITTLDFSKTTVATIPATILVGTGIATNSTLQTVTLNTTITTLSAAFKGFTALSSIDLQNDAVLTTLVDNEFDGCTALTSVNLTKITTLGESCFANTGLTSVSFHKGIAAIPEKAFWECAGLTSVTFASDYATFNGIGEYGFAYTGIASITIPKVLTDADDAIAQYAFQGCASLKDFTYAPSTTPSNDVVNTDAFKRCENVIFHTTQDYATTFSTAPTNTTYDYDVPSEGVKFNTLTPNPVIEYKMTPGKYFIKWTHATKVIKVKKSDAKVYDAYLDETDKTLNMIMYKAKGGYYEIAANHAALILTDNADLEYEETTGTGTSWLTLASVNSALEINAAATTRATLESGVADDELQLFVWSNSATKGVGFGKYTGSNIPAGTLYCFAKPDEENASAPKIAWFDENGFETESPIDNGNFTGIESVETAKEANDGAIYNLAGQKVSADYKGVVIKNGKKVMMK